MREGGGIFLLNQHLEDRDEIIVVDVSEKVLLDGGRKEVYQPVLSEESGQLDDFEYQRIFLKKEGYNLLSYLDYVVSEQVSDAPDLVIWKRDIEEVVVDIDRCLVRLAGDGALAAHREEEMERLWLEMGEGCRRLGDIRDDIQSSVDVLSEEQKGHGRKILDDMIGVLTRLIPGL